jgi:probable rRNA maturation factor
MAILATVLVLIDPPRADISEAALRRFAGRARQLAGVRGQVDVLITDNRRLRELNRRFRHKSRPTDVLSFPSPKDGGGDIAISAEIAAENAAGYGHSVPNEVKVLILHGMLHLAGYDHERDNGEMAARENALRARLGLPAGLIERLRF